MVINETVSLVVPTQSLTGQIIIAAIKLVLKSAILGLSLWGAQHVKLVSTKIVMTIIFAISAILTGVGAVELFHLIKAAVVG